MLVKRLIEHFDSYTTLPVDVNDVRDQLIERGVQDEIEFHFVSMDVSKIRGILRRYTKHSAPYSDPKFHSDILIARDMGEEDEAWKRLVAVKEILHISDSDKLSAQSAVAVDHLFQNFSLPPEIRTVNIANGQTKQSFFNDHITIYFAMAILIPQKCRKALRKLHTDQIYSPREIASIAKIPLRYIPLILGSDFDRAIAAFLDWEANIETAK